MSDAKTIPKSPLLTIANLAVAVYLHFNVQAMIHKQQRFRSFGKTLPAYQFVLVGQLGNFAIIEFYLKDDVAILVDESVFAHL